MIQLDVDDLLHIASRVVPGAALRDAGHLAAAAARPLTTVGGVDVYPDLHTKAAAMLHSIVVGHPLVDGNKRLGLASVIAFLGINGEPLGLSEDAAYRLVMDVAEGRERDVAAIADRLRG